MEKIALTIKSIRQKKNLKQEYVALKLGISCASYANLENNRTKITLTRLEQLACVFEMEAFDLVTLAKNCSLGAKVKCKGIYFLPSR